MRVDIVHPGAGELHYEIRSIVEFAQKLEQTGLQITWENIGDPVVKGEQVPQWIRDIVADQLMATSDSYGYSPTKGLLKTRQFLADLRNRETGRTLDANDILFFNGLGDAINKVYTWLNPVARVLGPSPAYPTHSSLEAAHGRSPHNTYLLDPSNNWLPDINDVRNKVKYNPNIAALLLINPDNPTGMVYSRQILQAFVDIAREYNLFLIADEIYANLTYDPKDFVSMAELSAGVPTMIMRGLSKEVPWPGSRCGWVEFYDTNKDASFAAYTQSILEAKMTEVCSTTLPQMVLPAILSDKRYADHLRSRCRQYESRAQQAATILSASPYLRVVQPKGAFYLSVTFTDDFAHSNFVLPAANPQAQALLDKQLASTKPNEFDKRFCYQLLAATGICTVPLTTGFNSHIPGFRMTLLEADSAKLHSTLQSIVDVLQ
jgi:alanine-synthesizing transaminase